MALPDHCRNLFGPKAFGDITFVSIVIGAGAGQAALVAAQSSPGITVATPGSGVYTVTFPCGTFVNSVGQECVNSGTDKVSVTALSITSGVCTLTCTKNDTTDCASTEQIHLTFATGQI